MITAFFAFACLCYLFASLLFTRSRLKMEKVIIEMNKDRIVLTHRVNQLSLIVGIMKLDNSYPVQKTISDIIISDQPLKHKDAICIFLKYLAEEYVRLKANISQDLKHEDDLDEQDRLKSMIAEIDSIMNLSTMVSEESSLEYMIQVFNEICVGVKKLKSL